MVLVPAPLRFLGHPPAVGHRALPARMRERQDNDKIMQGHEMVHYEQMERDGVFVFLARYLWYAARVGYWANPYEVEAYARFRYDAD